MKKSQDNDELFLSPHVRVAGMNRMAFIESEELAESFLDGCRIILNKRYNKKYEVTVVKFSTIFCSINIEKIENDSNIIKKRIDTNNYSCNINDL